MIKIASKIRFKPGHIPLSILKFGLPLVIMLLSYIIYYRITAQPDQLIYITRELYSMLEHAFMSLVILFGGATAFEAVAKNQ
ncbi:MAG: hypothetical protein ACYCWE_10390 [Eubacteriales bacterium]